MLRTTLGPDDAATIADLLAGVGQARGLDADLAAAAAYWSAAIDPDMETADLATVAWLLCDAAGWRRLPSSMRDRARYWAAYLDGRLQS